MSHSSLPPSAQNLILLSKEHLLTTLLVLDAHKRSLHNRVREILSELLSANWVVRETDCEEDTLWFCCLSKVSGSTLRVYRPHLYLRFDSGNQDLSKLLRS